MCPLILDNTRLSLNKPALKCGIIFSGEQTSPFMFHVGELYFLHTFAQNVADQNINRHLNSDQKTLFAETATKIFVWGPKRDN